MEKVWRAYVIEQLVKRCIETNINMRYCIQSLVWVHPGDRRAVFDFVTERYKASEKWGILSPDVSWISIMTVQEPEPIFFA